jgi:hypothetical protein
LGAILTAGPRGVAIFDNSNRVAAKVAASIVHGVIDAPRARTIAEIGPALAIGAGAQLDRLAGGRAQ